MPDSKDQSAATAMAAAKALRQKYNENTPKFLAAGMVGIMVVFMIIRSCRIISMRTKRSSNPNLAIRVIRKTRSLLVRKCFFFTSTGHGIIYFAYIATNIAITFVNVDWSSLTGFAKRLGWTTVSNLALITFLALKNTPLAFLTTYTHERLNILHRLAGYTIVTLAMLHGVVYITSWAKAHTLHELTEADNIMGIVAGTSLLIILATSLLLRKLRYEVFYVVHITLFMLILIAVGMHRPVPSKKTLYVVIFTASIWIADRLLRFLKIAYNAVNNFATLTPLPHGGTKITLAKPLAMAKAGEHCFLWIPSIRGAETHPFTVVGTEPMEFVVRAYDGFTRDLYQHALANPGGSVRASVDGSYGHIPNYEMYERVVFIAGGGGGSYTFGVAVELLKKLEENDSHRVKSIDFTWVIRDHEMTTWFQKALDTLHASPLVNLRLHITGLPASSASTSTLSDLEKTTSKTESIFNSGPPTLVANSEINSSTDIERYPKTVITNPTFTANSLPISNSPTLNPDLNTNTSIDIEKHPETLTTNPTSKSLISIRGRPDIPAFISNIVSQTDKRERIAIAACGPESMMESVRYSAARNIKGEGPDVEVFLEQFGW